MELYNEVVTDDVKTYLDLMLNDSIIYVENKYNEFVLFDMDKHFGLIFHNDVWGLFNCLIELKNTENINIKADYIKLYNNSIQEINNDYTCEYMRYFYHSEKDPACEWVNEIDLGYDKYLSSYGTGPEELNKIFELIAKYILKFKKEEHYNKYKREDDEVYTDEITKEEFEKRKNIWNDDD